MRDRSCKPAQSHRGFLVKARLYQRYGGVVLALTLLDVGCHSKKDDISLLLLFSVFTNGQNSFPCRSPDPATGQDTLSGRCDIPSFSDNGNGTVTDSVNRMLWTRCSLDGITLLPDDAGATCNGASGVSDVFNFNAAKSACDNLTYAGRSDWVLPDATRLPTLAVAQGASPHIHSFFPGTPGTSPNYFSGTTWKVDTNRAMSMDFSTSQTFSPTGMYPGVSFKTSLLYVRCIVPL